MTDSFKNGVAMHGAKEQLENAEIIRQVFEGGHERNDAYYEKLFSPDAMIWADSRSDNPVVWKEPLRGPQGFKTFSQSYGNHGYKYEIILNDIFTCGPLVVVNRTDIRKEDGKPDKVIPAVAVFGLKDGKIITWHEYYR